jgi:hypothetical protein
MQVLLNLHGWFQWGVLGAGVITTGWIIYQIFSSKKSSEIDHTLLIVFLRSLEFQTALGGVIITWLIITRNASIPVLVHGLIGLLPAAVLHWVKNQKPNWSERTQHRNTISRV